MQIYCGRSDGPTTPEADAILIDRKIECIPGILANAGSLYEPF